MGISEKTQGMSGKRSPDWPRSVVSLVFAGSVLIDVALQHNGQAQAFIRFLVGLCGAVTGGAIVLALLVKVEMVRNVSLPRLITRASLLVFMALITDVFGREFVLHAEEHRMRAIVSALPLPETTMCPAGLSAIRNYLSRNGSVCVGGGCYWECSCIRRGAYLVILHRGVRGRDLGYTSDRSTVWNF